MQPKPTFKWLLGGIVLITVFLWARSWASGKAEAKSWMAPSLSPVSYLPLLYKYPTPTPTNTPTKTPTPTSTPTPASGCPAHYGVYEQQLYAMINAERENAGLELLDPHNALETSAGEHSDDMAVNHFLSHTGSDGSTACQRVMAAGYPNYWCAEIIMHANSPQAAMDWWMNEPLHRDMILGNFNDFGAGYARCDGDSGYFTVDFGHR